MDIFIIIALSLIVISLFSISNQIKHLHIFLSDWKDETQGKSSLEDTDFS